MPCLRTSSETITLAFACFKTTVIFLFFYQTGLFLTKLLSESPIPKWYRRPAGYCITEAVELLSPP